MDDHPRRDLDFLFEMGSIRHIARTWVQFGGLDMANNAEHIFRVAWIAAVLAQREGARVDRVVLLALAHDIGESRTGDVHYLSRQYTSRDEDLAMSDIGAGTSVEALLAELHAEWEAEATIEARVARDADTLDVDFELAERRAAGATLPDAFAPSRAAAHAKLRTASGRLIAAELDASPVDVPHRWHLEARNRLKAGDWKPPAEGG